MAYYFGYKPTEKLLGMFDEIDKLMNGTSSDPYYKHRNLVTHQVARELTDNLLVNLLDVIPNPERKASMQKIVGTIEKSTDTLLNILLGKDKDKDVLPTIEFLKNDSLFIDNDGNTRVGFKLSDEAAKIITEAFDSVTPESVDIEKFQQGLHKMNHAVLHHFITRFADTLPLGMIKRKSVPVTKAGITKGMDMAVNRLFPQLDTAGLNRLVNFYRPFIVEKTAVEKSTVEKTN